MDKPVSNKVQTSLQMISKRPRLSDSPSTPQTVGSPVPIETKIDEMTNFLTSFFELRFEALTRQLQTSDEKFEKLYKKIEHLDQGLRTNEREIIEIKECLLRLDLTNRENNIVIFGLEEQKGEQLAEKFSSLMDDLKLNNIELKETYRLGNGNSNGIRPILTKLHKKTDREKIMENANKLKGTGIFITRDLPKEIRTLKREKRLTRGYRSVKLIQSEIPLDINTNPLTEINDVASNGDNGVIPQSRIVNKATYVTSVDELAMPLQSYSDALTEDRMVEVSS